MCQCLRRPPPQGRLQRPATPTVRDAHAANHALRAALIESRRARGGAQWPPGAEHDDEDEIRRTARLFGQRSISSVRCAWGSSQEAGALAAMLEALPASATLEEVGLAVLSPEDLPTASLRRAAHRGELPTLGASPDAMLRPRSGAPLEAVEVKNVCACAASNSPPPRLQALVSPNALCRVQVRFSRRLNVLAGEAMRTRVWG